MNQSQITMPALLSMPFRPLRIWLIKQRKTQSLRNVEVIQRQRLALEIAERMEHEKQIVLNVKQRQIERGL